jgi:acetophenone carboxylase
LYCVDIDTGGTMTDTLVTGGAAPVLIKVESTPHDVTVSFLHSLEAAAAAVGVPTLSAFLDQVKLIRWSSTITSNVLAQRSGPKLGLIVTAGHERDLYARDPRDLEQVVPSLVRPENVAGLTAGADAAQVVALVKGLIDRGIRRVNISLAGAFPDGAREQEILGLIGERFPDHFLGSVPALAGSDMLMRPDDMSRTFMALINSYVHNSLASSLFRAEDMVKVEHNWKGDILVGHLNGGVARIGKTKAVDTIESGPLFGTHASAHVAQRLRLGHVLAVDIGGTTAKASTITRGRIDTLPEGNFFGIPVRMPMPILRSIALGGGSVVRVAQGAVTLGPDSMGAAPGPACYGLGGNEATLTDALVVLGVVSPTAFLGGRRQLDVARATRAIAEHVATPLGIEPAAAARRVVDRAVAMMAVLAREAMREAGWGAGVKPVLFAYGGNGPLFATGLAQALGLNEIRLFALGTVFSAYGSAIADVLHVYESALVSADPQRELAVAGERLSAQARRDLRGEGFDSDGAQYHWSAESGDGRRATASGADADACAALLQAVPAPQLLRLEARFGVGTFEVPARPTAATTTTPGTRPSALVDAGALPVHAHDGVIGRALDGPFAVDGGTFTWLVESGWRLDVDRRGDASLLRTQRACA